MRILAISDHQEQQLYEYFDSERWVGKVDLAISCGDLPGDYLSYLVTVLRVPLLYVAGNHDSRYRVRPPDGCDNIDGKLMRVGDLRIAGLAGCLRYNAGPEDYQFTEREMRWRVRRLSPAIWRAGGVDLVVTHAAPHRCPLIARQCFDPAGTGKFCIHPELEDHPAICPEAIDVPHRAVVAYNSAIRSWRPRWWLHGHNHIEYGRVPRLWWVDGAQVINADGHVLIDTAQTTGSDRGSMVASF